MTRSQLQRVLIVDESAAGRALVDQALDQLKVVCDRVGSASEALSMLTAEQYDLITLELDMAGTSAQQMLATLRERQPRTPVLVIAGASAAEDRLNVLYELGASAVLHKPFSESMVYAVAHSLLQRQHGRLWMR